MKKKRILSIFLAVVFLFSMTTKEAQADWVDKSNELPGMAGDGAIIALTAVAVVGVGVLVYVLVKKKKNKSETTSTNSLNNYQIKVLGNTVRELNSTVEVKTSAPNPGILTQEQNSLLQKMETASLTIPVDIMISPLNSSNNLAFGNTNGIQVGIRIRF